MKKIFIPIACLAMLFAACTDTEVMEKGTSPDLVSFSTYMGQSTRAAATTTANFTNFGVSAYYSVSDQWATSKTSASCNYMDNDKVTGSSITGWTYDHPKYWPKSGYVNFWAWSPATSDYIEWGGTGVPNFTYTVQDAVASQEDLVVALATDKQKGLDGKVSLNFSHLLSKIGFSAKLAEDYSPATVKVTEMKVTYKESAVKNAGVYTYEAGWADTDPVSYHGAITNSLLDGSGSGNLNNSTPTPLNTDSKYLMLLPQSAGAEALSAKITYTVTYPSDGVVTTNVETIELPAQAWESGKQYTYNLTISLTGVKFDVTSVTPWGDAAVVEINNQPIAEFTGAPIALGYEATSKAEFSTSGISKIDPVNDDDFSVSYSPTTTKAISGVTGTLTFAPTKENVTNATIEKEIPVTVYDVLGNKSIITFTVQQAAKFGLFNGTTLVAGVQTLVYNSTGVLYSLNTTPTVSVNYVIAGVTDVSQVVVSGYDATVFAVDKTTTALTITANAATFGDLNKSTTFTVTLNNAEEDSQVYNFTLERCAKPAMKNGTNVIPAGDVPVINFKSTREKGSEETVTGADLINVSSVSGDFATNANFTVAVTNDNARVDVTALSDLTGAGKSNTKLEGTFVLTNKCGESTTYNMSAEQYAMPYLLLTKKDGTVRMTGEMFVSASSGTQKLRFPGSGGAYYTYYVESKFASYTSTKNGNKTLQLTAGERGTAQLEVIKDSYQTNDTKNLTITLYNAINESISYTFEVTQSAIVSNNDKWE